MKSYVKPGIFMVSLHTEERLAGSACNGSCDPNQNGLQAAMDMNGDGVINASDVYVYLQVS